MDMSNYGIRVIITDNTHDFGAIKPSSRTPIDIEGTLLRFTLPSIAKVEAIARGDWFNVFFGRDQVYATVRWDNDYKGQVPVASLSICSFGKLSVCWPIYGPSKEELSNKFDRRLAEERLPRTAPPKALTIKTAYRTISERFNAKSLDKHNKEDIVAYYAKAYNELTTTKPRIEYGTAPMYSYSWMSKKNVGNSDDEF